LIRRSGRWASKAGQSSIQTLITSGPCQCSRSSLPQPEQGRADCSGLAESEVDQASDGQEVRRPERAATRGHHDERIDGVDIRPGRRQRDHLPVLVGQGDAVLVPGQPPVDERELPPGPGMERVRDPHNSGPTALIGCS
jgi:hypothetical protein